MFLKYGTYTHAQGEAEVSISRAELRTGTDQVYGYTERWTINGQLIGTSATNIDSQVESLEAAYAINERDLIFLLPDGSTPSELGLLTASCAGGTRVAMPPSYPSNRGAAYVTFLPYQIVVEGDVITDVTVTSEFHETLTFSGGGAVYGHLETLASAPVKQLLRRKSIYRATQAGRAVGKFAYPSVPNPIWPGALIAAPTITRKNPRRRGGADYEDFETTWQYQFESRVPLSGNPNR